MRAAETYPAVDLPPYLTDPFEAGRLRASGLLTGPVCIGPAKDPLTGASPIYLPAGLSDHLNLLTRAGLGEPAELATTPTDLAEAAAACVPSCCGLQLTVVQQGCPVTVTVLDPTFPHGAHVSSLSLPLPALGPADGHLSLYARNPGALVDLAADLTYALHLPDPTYLSIAVCNEPEPTADVSAGADPEPKHSNTLGPSSTPVSPRLDSCQASLAGRTWPG